MTFIVEAETVDYRALGAQPENARAWIALLRARRHSADFGKAHAHGKHGVRYFAIFVKAGRDTKRIGEMQSETVDAQRDGIKPMIGRTEAET